jgi:hypothetical protein
MRGAIGLSGVTAAVVAVALFFSCSPFASSTSTSVDGSTTETADSGAIAADGGAAIPAADDGGLDGGALHSSSALVFDGVDAHVESPFVAIPQELTLEAWVCPDQYDATHDWVIFAEDQSGAPAQEFRLGLDGQGRLFFVMSDGFGNNHGMRSGSTYNFTSVALLPLGKFTHVAVTKSIAQFTFFINGQEDTSKAFADFTRDGPHTQMRIAARVDSDGKSVKDPFKGTIDEVRLWDVARTTTQIAAAMKTEISLSDPDFAHVVSYWRFDEGAGSMTSDTKSGAAGNLVATPKWTKSTAF